MQTQKRNSLKLLTVLLLVLGLLGSGLYQWNAQAAPPATLPATPCAGVGTGTVTCELWAASGTIALPNNPAVPIWGYSATDPGLGGTPSLPGPVLIVNQGDSVTVTLHNGLAEATALLFNGQSIVPDTAGVAAGGTKAYTFTASQPGTFLYQASPLLSGGSAHQVAMGLYGALVVRPTAAPPAGFVGQAYSDASTAFNEESLLVLSEIDLNLNNNPSPASFDLRYYHPTYFLINGTSYPDTAPIEVNGNSKVLLRFVNAGLQAHSMSVLGLTQSVIAVGGSPYSFARKLTADTIFSGQTADAIVTMPNLDGEHQYAVYDAIFPLSNNTSSGFGGMLTFLKMGVTVPPPADTVGPATNGVNLSPDKVGGASPAQVALSATISDVDTGGSAIQAAEYFIDAKGLDGSGTQMVLNFINPSLATASDTIITTSIPNGTHTVYVHGQDAVGNWGSFGTAVLTVDKAGPLIFSLELVPNPSNGSSVLLHATADDRSTGNSEITSIEYQLGGGPWIAMSYDATAASTFYWAELLLNQAGGTISVRATDTFGNIGMYFDLANTMPATIVQVVDQLGPTTSNVTATPGSTNGINQQLNSSVAAVRITASFSDGPSNVSKAEAFIGVPGATGTGIVFVSTDGLFDSPNETGYIDIPLAQFWIMGPGTYTINVHAQDASGNWGVFSSTNVTVVP